MLIQTYAIATITYLGSMFLIPNLYVNRIHQAIFQFLWDNKNELVSRATCHLPMNQGGLGIPDVHATRTISIIKWIKHLTNTKMTSIWLQYGRYWTGQVLGGIKEEWKWLRSNLTPHGDPSKIPKWYKLLIEFVSEHCRQLSQLPDTELTSKSLKKLLQHTHQPRCVAEWQRTVYP